MFIKGFTDNPLKPKKDTNIDLERQKYFLHSREVWNCNISLKKKFP